MSKAAAIRIHEQLQQQIEATLFLSGLPVIRSTEATQTGSTFGQRLANAVSDCWAEGYEKLIIVGGDSPELTTKDIFQARDLLAAGRPTIGENLRGGSFLIGLFKDGFRQNQFAELPWQTSRIACAIKNELGIAVTEDENKVYELEARADCNTRQDLINFAKRSASEAWSYLLRTTTGRFYDIETGQVLVSRFGESQTKRGPPALALAA